MYKGDSVRHENAVRGAERIGRYAVLDREGFMLSEAEAQEQGRRHARAREQVRLARRAGVS